MKKHSLALFAFLSFCLTASAQTDSITFVNAKWETKTIAPGVQWKHYSFKHNLFDTNENVNILEINPNKKIKLAVGYEKQVLKQAGVFATQANAIAAINGGFFDVKNGGGVDMIKVNGEVISENRLSKSGQRAIHQKAALLFNKGVLSIAKWDGTSDWESHLEGDIMDAGPLLIYHNNMEHLDSGAFVRLRHPRTAVAVTHNRVLLITVDGRNVNSGGVNLHELAKILKWLNATDGVNMDGGGSTTLWINNQSPNGVVNYPCDNKKWDHEGARKVANVVLVEK